MMPANDSFEADAMHLIAPVQAKTWLQQPVTRQQAVIASCITALLWMCSVGAATAYLYETWQGQATVTHQSLNVRLPNLMLANADIQSIVQTKIDTTIHLSLPLHQQLLVDLPASVKGQSLVNVNIPVDTRVVHAFVLNLMAPIDTHVSVATWLPDVHVKFALPMTVPIEMDVPVRASVPLSMKIEATAKLPDTIRVPIDTLFKLQIPLHQALNLTAVSRTAFALHDSKADIPMHLTKAKLTMPLSDMVLQPTRLTNDSKANSSIHSTTDRQIKPTALRK